MQRNRETILYICNRRQNVDVRLCQQIIHNSHWVIWAKSVFDALHKASYHDISLVIIDNNLYGMKGVDVAKTIKKCHPELGIILLTSFENYSPEICNLDEGVLFFLKPYNPSEVMKAIRYLMQDYSLNYTNLNYVPIGHQLSLN